MPPFREDSIAIIALGSQTTLAQLGLPESFTPARLHIPSRMYKVEDGLWTNQIPDTESNSAPEPVFPIVGGRIVNWDCFFGLLSHVIREINPGFYSPYMIVTEPCWTVKDCERITQFLFEQYKPPALAMMDAAMATSYGFGLQTATIVDVGYQKIDVTAISDHIVHERSRVISLPGCGGDAMTDRLSELLKPKGFTRDMCEQLKHNPITEVLPPGIALPGTTLDSSNNPTEAASPAAILSSAAAASGTATTGDDLQVDDEGVLDVTTLLTSNNMGDILSRKEKERAEKSGKKEADANQQQKQLKLRNIEKVSNTFVYEKPEKVKPVETTTTMVVDEETDVTAEGVEDGAAPPAESNLVEVEVGLERFQAVSGGILDRIADAVYKTIQSVDEMSRRPDLWDSIVVVGNGSRIKGLKEALVLTLRAKFLITPSTGTTSFSLDTSRSSTPSTAATGTTTPVPGPGAGPSSSVNPLLVAATTANLSLPHFVAHTQTPTSIKFARMPEYFPEWKEVGYEEGVFLGGQVAARVLFISDQANNNKGYMTRTDYNEMGPTGISEFRI